MRGKVVVFALVLGLAVASCHNGSNDDQQVTCGAICYDCAGAGEWQYHDTGTYPWASVRDGGCPDITTAAPGLCMQDTEDHGVLCFYGCKDDGCQCVEPDYVFTP
jgi:hypothetical protein